MPLCLHTQRNTAILALGFGESDITGIERCVDTGWYIFPLFGTKTEDKEQKQDIDMSQICKIVNSIYNVFHL